MKKYSFLIEAFGFSDTKITYNNPYYTIHNFNFHSIQKYANKFFGTDKVTNFIEVISDKWYNHSFRIHKFFVPELIYFLKNTNTNSCKNLIKLLSENTWYRNVVRYEKEDPPDIVQLSEISKNITLTLKDYQLDFIKSYSKKQIYDLRGYILAFEQGLGKTLTSLALMTALKKKCVIIIAPKKTLISVWKSHIDGVYKNKKKIWIAGFQEDDPFDCDYYITNYESMTKLFELPIPKNCGIIVDESHNFLHIGSNRSQNLILLSKKLRSDDILLMSGTPLKAIGTEMIPMLTILDRNFDEIARDIFIKSFGLNTNRATKIFHNRLGLIMYRKLKNDVLDLPEKHELIKKVKTPNAKEYTIKNVKTKILKFIRERKLYHGKRMKEYNTWFDEVLSYLETTKIAKTKDFLKYKQIVSTLRSHKHLDDLSLIHWCVEYEKKVITPLLTSNLKKKFLKCKSAVKYLSLKIMGEVIGGFLVELRNKMCQEIIEYGKLEEIIWNAKKKTILFTSYADCVKLANSYYKQKGLQPCVVYGGTKDVESIFKIFKTNTMINPMIATIQTLSTGVTLTEANTIIFLNKPWRYIEYQQASDRIHRIGQDTEVFIYTLLLDTGSEPNLSTRMEEIESWSKDMFKAIIDGM